ncbi:Lrp/AsnC family transcriptional regulator [Halobacillus sp. ACCC02827]|uniref:Lrp/AsnC family transcriptional regulator n=1 Tax=Bacillaceae TaxID=186817 RepID=UPI000409B4D2|nr:MULTISPECIES: Lrp/AsnC family transcriptional regulator [Bacillaceae]QHT47890.1 Lrp/AsnC family transcriptional regulator [Bacillus sp. SB49]WJE15123.1 Lrp/AsnC family transcriptional regulator [Halobacillus sp. ACCC02827]
MLDQTDWQIIKELTKNSRIKMKELGDKVHLTGQAAASRVAKLEDQGIIEGYTITLNQQKVGWTIHAFLTIITESIHHRPYLEFVDANKEYVSNHYKISGDGCYILECRFPSYEELDAFLVDLNKQANYKLSIVINKQPV